MTRTLATLSALTAVCLFTPLTQAGTSYTWDGSVNDWSTVASWTPNAVPDLNAGDEATINAGTVTYTGTVDFLNNGVLTVGGTGTWLQQTAIGNWSRLGIDAVGTLNVNTGGTYDAHDAGQFFVGTGTGTGRLHINGGSATFNTLTIQTASSDVTITSGGSLTVNAGLNLTSGGSLSVGGDISITGPFNFTNGSLAITPGGDMTIAGNFVIPTGTTTLSVTGGLLQINGEFKPQVATTTVSGGTVNANLISFDAAGANSFDFSGGQINLAPGVLAFSIYTAGLDDYVNYTTGSTGSLFILGGDATLANGFITGGQIRLDNLIESGAFSVVEHDGGVSISLTSIPEPATMALLGAGFMFITARRRRKMTESNR